jgi:hypothetical protein
MDIVYIGKFRYEIQDQKEVPVWYTGISRLISNTTYMLVSHLHITTY